LGLISHIARTRRVKCDEGRPGCARCEKFGIICQGYLVPGQKAQPVTKPLFPKQTFAPLAATSHAEPARAQDQPRSGFRLVYPLMYAGAHFSDEQEYRYFHFYCHEVASQLSRPYGTQLWERLIPQAGVIDQFIVHAIIALGAVCKARAEVPSPLDSRSVPPSNHYRYALTEYSKALRGMRASLTGRPDDIRKAVIGCLLIFCFETLQANELVASIHASQLMSLVQHTQRGSNTGNRPTLSYASLQLEEEFYGALSGLDIQNLLYLDGRPRDIHTKYKEELNAALTNLPERFVAIKESRDYLQLIMQRNLHFIVEAKSRARIDQRDLSGHPLCGVPPEMATWSHTSEERPQIPPGIIAERDQYMEDIYQWERASKPFFDKEIPADDTNSELFLISNLLLVHAAMNTIILYRIFQPPETGYDAFLPQFQTVVSCSAAVHHLLTTPIAHSSSPVFRFDVGIIPALSQAGILCRDSGVRRRAVELLMSQPRYREGIWQSVAAGMIADWIRGLEESWLDENGYVPGNRRASLIHVDSGFHERWVKVACLQRDGKDGNGFEMKEAVLSW